MTFTFRICVSLCGISSNWSPSLSDSELALDRFVGCEGGGLAGSAVVASGNTSARPDSRPTPDPTDTSLKPWPLDFEDGVPTGDD